MKERHSIMVSGPETISPPTLLSNDYLRASLTWFLPFLPHNPERSINSQYRRSKGNIQIKQEVL
jgi:hypothetical protein